MPPERQDPQENKKSIDIDKILLPKKEEPGKTVDSAQRINAGALFDQEVKAGTEGFDKPAVAPKPAAPATPPAAPKEESIVKPLTTYKGAIEEAMKGGNVSIVSMAAAEAERRSQKGTAKPVEEAAPTDYAALAKKYGMIGAGLLLTLIAASAFAYLFSQPTSVPVAPQVTAPFIAIDQAVVVSVASNESARDIVNKLNSEKSKVSLALGLVARLVPSIASSTPDGSVFNTIDAQTFLTRIAPDVPTTLLRTIDPTYLLGVHVYNDNQAFLIFRVDSYQAAFSGMLEWELNMRKDLSPLFNYTPRERIPEENAQVVPPSVIVGTTTASSTPATTIPTTTKPDSVATLPAKFIDKIVENHDARVLQNQYGDMYFMWTFLDRNTLVITTNPATLREVISRLQSAAITPIPGQ